MSCIILLYFMGVVLSESDRAVGSLGGCLTYGFSHDSCALRSSELVEVLPKNNGDDS